MKDLKSISLRLAKQCLSEEKTFEAAFNELFYEIHTKPFDRKTKTVSKRCDRKPRAVGCFGVCSVDLENRTLPRKTLKEIKNGKKKTKET